MSGSEPRSEAGSESGEETGRRVKVVKRSARLRRTTSLAVLSALLLSYSGRPQTVYSVIQQSVNSPFEPPFGDNYLDPLLEEKRLRALNADRQKAIVGDAIKLLHLATELSAEVDQEKPDTLSPNQMRKLAEIEKLAHSVKEKMRTSVRLPVVSPALIR
jgi:hypothetical protein